MSHLADAKWWISLEVTDTKWAWIRNPCSHCSSLIHASFVHCLSAEYTTSDSPFPPNQLWFLEPWCYLVNQPEFPPVLSRTTVVRDASVEGVAQCTATYRIWHAHFGLPFSSRKTCYFLGFQLRTNFFKFQPNLFLVKILRTVQN